MHTMIFIIDAVIWTVLVNFASNYWNNIWLYICFYLTFVFWLISVKFGKFYQVEQHLRLTSWVFLGEQ